MDAASCGQVLGQFIYGARNFLNILHVVGPILLILSLVISFGKGVINPEVYNSKNGFGYLNSIIAAIVLFMLPALLDATMILFGQSFRISNCWNQVANQDYSNRSSGYVPVNGEKQSTDLITTDSDTDGDGKVDNHEAYHSVKNSSTNKKSS